MALDFSRVKSAQVKAQTSGKFEKKDYTKIYYKPIIGKQKVRIVPWKEDPNFPFVEVQLHKYDTFKRMIPTLANYGEVDPILKMRDKVFKDKTSSEDEKEFMKNFTPRNSMFVQVIVRGQEDLGVRLWELNKTNYETILGIMADEDEVGDITDIVSGRDLIVTGSNAVNPKTGKSYVEVSIIHSVKQTPLSDNAAQVKDWTTNQLVPLEQYTKLSSEELKKLFNDFCNPADEEEEEAEETPAPVKAPAPGTKFAKVADPELDPELAEEEDELPPPAPKAKPAPKAPAKAPVAKKAPVVAQEEDDELDEDDELSDAIPKTKAPPAPAPAPKAKPAAPKADATSAAKKFAALYEDDED